MSRTCFLSLLTLLAALLAPPATAQLADVGVEKVLDGLPVPLAVTHAGDTRLFVTLLDGRVMIVEDGELRQPPFLDLRDRTGQGSGGLWSIAFHPDYATNGFVYAHWVERGSLDSIVARYQVRADNPDRVAIASQAILLRIPKKEVNHYGGQLEFGPDGYLYVSTGDGTGPRRPDPDCVAQSTSSLEGKVLRLDVDRNVDEQPFYAVPDDNPFAGSGHGEIWGLGLRNPWRFAFDELTGDLWLADVGEDRREEVNYVPSGTGGGRNYGWKVMEGSTCFRNRNGCGAEVPECHDAAYTLPAIEYAHDEGRCSVIGGRVYRGSRVPELSGRYLYGDFCTGEVWAAVRRGGTVEAEKLGFELPGLNSFGVDASGELWLTSGDALYRLVETGESTPSCTADQAHLCLTGGRFEVAIHWRAGDGTEGMGQAVELTDDAGYYWFFSPNNPEVFVKVLDACFDPFDHFWVFAAGLTDVETRLEVTDTQTGEVRVYEHAVGTPFVPVRDTTAFATCP